MGTLERKVTFTQHVGREGRLSLKGVAGPITLRAVDGDEIRVRITYRVRADDQASAERALEGGEVRVERDTDLLSIETGERQFSRGLNWFFNGMRVNTEMEADVPRFVRVRVETVSGRVRAADLAGDQRYRTISGEIDLWALSGSIDASSVSGSIALDGGGDAAFKANTVSGEIRARARNFPAFRLSTTSGHIGADGALDPRGDYRADSISGSFDLSTPTGVTAELKTLSGSIHTQLPNRLDGSRGNWRAVVGDGAAHVRFNSTSGSLHLLRFDAWPAAGPVAPDAGAAAGGDPVGAAPGYPPAPASGWTPEPAPETTSNDWNSNAAEAPGETPVETARPEEIEVLRALEAGEITVEEAASRLERARR